MESGSGVGLGVKMKLDEPPKYGYRAQQVDPLRNRVYRVQLAVL